MNSSGISTAISETVSEMMVKPICSAPFSAASQRRLALFDVAGDVLDHDDGVVDHEAGRDGQRHQRQVVEAEAAAGTSPPNVPTSDSGTDRLGMMRRRHVAQEHEDHQHDQHHGEHQLELHVARPRRGWSSVRSVSDVDVDRRPAASPAAAAAAP